MIYKLLITLIAKSINLKIVMILLVLTINEDSPSLHKKSVFQSKKVDSILKIKN